MYNELTMTYKMGDGRTFKAERGTTSVDLGYEGHGMFGLKFNYNWGLITSTFYGLDYVEDFEVDIADRVQVPEEYMHLLITSVIKVFNVDYLSSINDRECYLLFDEENRLHGAPVGIVNIRDTQNLLIFTDLLEPYRR